MGSLLFFEFGAAPGSPSVVVVSSSISGAGARHLCSCARARTPPLGSFVCSLAMRAAAALLLCSLVLCEAYQLGGIGTMPETQAPGWMPVMPTLGLRHMCRAVAKTCVAAGVASTRDAASTSFHGHLLPAAPDYSRRFFFIRSCPLRLHSSFPFKCALPARRRAAARSQPAWCTWTSERPARVRAVLRSWPLPTISSGCSVPLRLRG